MRGTVQLHVWVCEISTEMYKCAGSTVHVQCTCLEYRDETKQVQEVSKAVQ